MDLRERIMEEMALHPGMTWRSLSLAAGLSDSALHKFMTGKTKSLTTDNLEKIAKALGITARQLWWGDADGKLVYIFDHMSDRRKEEAIRLLEALADLDGEGEIGGKSA